MQLKMERGQKGLVNDVLFRLDLNYKSKMK